MSLFDVTSSALEVAIKGTEARQSVLANNLANVNTPNFKRSDVSFQGALASALGVGATATRRSSTTPRSRPRPTRRRRCAPTATTSTSTSSRPNLAKNQLLFDSVMAIDTQAPAHDGSSDHRGALMGLFDALDVSASGLTAERLRMDTIANNLANANSVKGADGKPFQRQVVELGARGAQGGGTGGSSFAIVRRLPAGVHRRRRPGARRSRATRPPARRSTTRATRMRIERATSRCRTSTRSPRWST